MKDELEYYKEKSRVLEELCNAYEEYVYAPRNSKGFKPVHIEQNLYTKINNVYRFNNGI